MIKLIQCSKYCRGQKSKKDAGKTRWMMSYSSINEDICITLKGNEKHFLCINFPLSDPLHKFMMNA